MLAQSAALIPLVLAIFYLAKSERKACVNDEVGAPIFRSDEAAIRESVVL